MKKAIKETAKTASPANKKNTRPNVAKKSGYTEKVYNNEEQSSYQKSDLNKNNKKNTSGPKS